MKCVVLFVRCSPGMNQHQLLSHLPPGPMGALNYPHKFLSNGYGNKPLKWQANIFFTSCLTCLSLCVLTGRCVEVKSSSCRQLCWQGWRESRSRDPHPLHLLIFIHPLPTEPGHSWASSTIPTSPHRTTLWSPCTASTLSGSTTAATQATPGLPHPRPPTTLTTGQTKCSRWVTPPISVLDLCF